MYDRFSDSARSVVAAAERQAFARGATEVGPEDVLVVLAGFDGVAGSVLRAVAADAALLNQAVARDAVAADPTVVRARPLSLAAATATAFTIAVREADGLGLAFVATEHLLLGLLREPAGRTTGLLLAVRRDPGLVRERLLDLLSSPGFISPEAPRVAAPASTAPASAASVSAAPVAAPVSAPVSVPTPVVAIVPDPVEQAAGPAVSLDEFDRELLETVLDEVARLRAEIALLRAELAGIDSQGDRNIA